MLKQIIRLASGLALAGALSTGALAGMAEEQAFLDKNAQVDGVTVTDSGLQIRTLKEGTGRNPAATDTVKVHYVGSTIDGDVFDSSYKRNRPIEFPLNRVIAGWTEGLQLMKEGAKAQLVIPAEIAYGTPGRCGHPDLCGKTLIFDVELIEVK
ncbi:MAG: FKBP-type peptidyl-prolyl cis-trans isomerase [Alphaproteobacteria bacterium]